MELKEFKKIINDYFLLNGFSKEGNYYYKESDEVVCALRLQKSKYSNCFYLNVGIVIKEINPNMELPRDVDGDIRFRFCFEFDKNKVQCLSIEKVRNSADIISSLKKNILELIIPSLNVDGIRKILDDKPVLLYQTNLRAKQHLGFE